MTQARVRAPQLKGRGWINTGGLTLEQLRGKIILLDFWTFCCINCLHVIEELRPLEEQYKDVLVIIGVHSPKFEHEKDPDALRAAVERYGVDHPVLDDVDMEMWRQYAARAWPTLDVIDPEGYVVASMAGEGHAEGLKRLIDELIAKHEAKGTLRRGEAPLVPVEKTETPLRFPGKALALAAGTLLVADSSHHSLVEIEDDETILRRIGTGQKGSNDGLEPQFNEPGGMCLLPPHVAEIAGYDVVVADTVNHLLRGLKLKTGEVSTVAGSGKQWRGTVDFDPHDSKAVDLSSPWDVAWYDDKVIVAMAGIHQLWWFDPVKRTAGMYAGTTVEALKDGPREEAWMAQPSGLSTAPDGSKLWIADSESSAIRWIENGELHTAVGQGLFDFGHVDGKADDALLQHPLGVLALADGSVRIADTYNGAIRRLNDGEVSTVADGLAEPSDIVLTPTGDVVVVESGAHRLTRLAPGTLDAAGLKGMRSGKRHHTERPPTMLAPGDVELDLIFQPPPGQKLDEQFGPSTRLEVSASPPELLIEGAGVTTELRRRLVISKDLAGGILQVTAQAATCDIDAEFPACHLTRQDWGVPIQVTKDGSTRLPLILRGMD
jgi:thiol-disulfide isomerase/thioredoxin